MIKYSDFFCKSLKRLGYTHCFILQGGSIMHLVNSANKYFKVIPFLHEHSATIAAEYFNKRNYNKKNKCWVLVTGGPGLTNSITAVCGAFYESRELLIVCGQSKTSDLKLHKINNIRQTGIQQVDNINIISPVTKFSKTFLRAENFRKIKRYTSISSENRKGPVFLEIPIDIQGRKINENKFKNLSIKNNIIDKKKNLNIKIKNKIHKLLQKSNKISILLGAGIDKNKFIKLKKKLQKTNFALFTTWNTADYLSEEDKNNFGRPNTWGQRYSNILIQKSDLLISIGSSLGIQQTGFNYKSFIKNGKIINVDIDEKQLHKKNPKTYLKIKMDAFDFLKNIIELTNKAVRKKNLKWISSCKMIKTLLSTNEKENNKTRDSYISPYDFYLKISKIISDNDNICPCSSGGAETTFFQVFKFKKKQNCINNKSLASMGYGLAGAIGMSLADKKNRTCLFEGDGGFTQNIQEIGTAIANNLNLKIFIFYDEGYASIRMTQKNYFNGEYVGCDEKTGLKFPNWIKFFSSYSVPVVRLRKNFDKDKKFLKLFNSKKISVFIVPIDPEQTYYPKITSKIQKSGYIISNPIDEMSPALKKEDKNIINLL